MGLVLLVVLYLALAAAIAFVAGRLAGPSRRPGLAAALVLSSIPLAFTAGGFQPGKSLVPTGMLAGAPPWAEPWRVEAMKAEGEPNPLLLDAVSQFLPWRVASRRDWLFNPSQGAGAALLANGQSAVLFPTEALARLLPPFRAATFSQAARLLLAVWGTFLLARALALSERAALLAAAAFAGAGFVQLWRLHPHTLVAAAAPWILFALVELGRRPDRRRAVLLAVCGAVGLFGGHPETLLHAVLFGLGLLGVVLWVGRHGAGAGTVAERGAGLGRRGAAGGAGLSRAGAGDGGFRPPGEAPAGGEGTEPTAQGRLGEEVPGAERRSGEEAPGAQGRLGEEVPGAARGHLGRVVLWGTAAACLSVLLAAPLLLPFVENLAVSWTWLSRRETGTVVEVPLAEALERLRPAFVPTVFGRPGTGEEWTGPENVVEVAGGAVGSVALLLAAVALGDRRRWRLAAGLLALGALGLAVSVHLPAVSWPFGQVPLLRESLLKRLSLWWALAVPLAAGIGLDRWLAAARGSAAGRGLGRLRAWVAGAFVVVAAALGWAAPSSLADPVALWTEWVPLAAAAALLALAPAGRPGRIAAVLVVAALLMPRVGLFARWVPATSALGFYPQTDGVSFVAERLRAEGGTGWRVAGLDAALVPHSAALFGFPEARANDPMTFAPFAEFAKLLGEAPPHAWNRVLDPGLPALAFLGVRWIFEHPSMGQREGVEIAYAGADAIVYESPRALPRAWVPREVEVWADPRAALAAAAGIDDFAVRVAASGEGLRDLGGARRAPGSARVRARDGLGDPAEPASVGAAPVRVANGPATVAELAAGGRRVHARVSAAGPALLATSQPAIPGWRAALDGEPAEPVLVHGAFLGLVVPPGEHEVDFVYAPRSWTFGLVACAVGMALGGIMLRTPRPRRPHADRAPP